MFVFIATSRGLWRNTRTPTVNVGNTPTVNLGPGNTVGINGFVQVGNTASSPVLVRDIENPAREPFQDAAICGALSGFNSCDTSITVPLNKLLVIETVTVIAIVPSGQKALAVIFSRSGGDPFNRGFSLAVTPQGTFGTDDIFVGTHSLRAYADPGSLVGFRLTRSDTSGQGSLQARIAGHLVDCGAGPGCPLP